jgi:hypothetical protein
VDEVPVQAAELKPMSLSELLDRTFTLYRNRFWLFCGLMVGPEVVRLTCSLIVIVAFPANDLAMAAPDPQNPFAAFASLVPRLAAIFLASFVALFFGGMALSAVTVTVSELYLGHAVTIRGAYEVVRGRVFGLFGLILTLMLAGLAFLTVGSVAGGLVGAIAGVALGAISPVLGAIVLLLLVFLGALGSCWLLMRFAVSIPAFMLERQGVTESMSRSGVLTRGNRSRILVAVIVMYVVLLAFNLGLGLPFIILQQTYRVRGLFPLWIEIGRAISATVASTIAAPLLMIAIVLIYYDARVRKDGFDLQRMLDQLPTPAAGEAGGSPEIAAS